jgi:predicted ATP-grasp superfamily ATP-dependent carboligase
MVSLFTELYFRIKKFSFLHKEILLYNLERKKKISVLFSDALCQKGNLQKGLRLTNIETNFKEFTIENIKKADLVVPLTIADLKYVNEVRDLLSRNLIPIPSLESINICDDKYLFYQTLIMNGFESYLPKIDTNLKYPYILKKKTGEKGDDNYVITDVDTEIKYKSLIDNQDYFCQEMVLGTNEYATHILFQDNKIVTSLNVEYIFKNSTPIKGQDKVASRRIVKFPYEVIFSEILSSIGFEGICCFNYKINDSNPFIIEINPRFGASLSLYFIAFMRQLYKIQTKTDNSILIQPALTEIVYS